MHDAAAMGDARAVARRLDRGEHPDQGIFLSQTPLHHAAARGKTSAVVALLDGGANASSCDVNGRTPLHCAAVSNCGGNLGPETTPSMSSRKPTQLERATVPSPPFVDVISQLVTRGGRERQRAGRQGIHPFTRRRGAGHYRCAVALIRAGADAKAVCLRRRKPVDYAHALETPHLVSLLTDPSGHLAGTGSTRRTPRSRVRNRAGARTPSPRRPRPPTTPRLISRRVSRIFPWTRMEETLIVTLDWCARAGVKAGRVRVRVAAAQEPGRRRGAPAARRRGSDCRRGAGGFYWRDGRPNEPARRGGNMHEDAAVGDAKAVADRLCAGEHPDQRNHAGATPMHAAAAAGHEVVVKNLIDGGGDRDAADARGRTPLMEACARGRLGCVRTLLRRGANSGAVDDMGRNAMHHAALAGGGDDVVAIVDALFDDVRQSATPVTHFANPRTPRRPHPVAVRDLGGRTPAQLCRIGAVKSRLVDLTQDVERRARTGGAERERPCPSRVPSVLPAEWARRARRVAEGIDPWPRRTCVEATRLISDILTAVENTGSGLVSTGEEGARLSALERMRALGCMPPALCKRVAARGRDSRGSGRRGIGPSRRKGATRASRWSTGAPRDLSIRLQRSNRRLPSTRASRIVVSSIVVYSRARRPVSRRVHLSEQHVLVVVAVHEATAAVPVATPPFATIPSANAPTPPARRRVVASRTRLAAGVTVLASASAATMSFFFFACTFFKRKNSSRSSSSSSPFMYCTVFSSRGVTTFSSAFTLRLVVLMATSRVMNAVCRLASSTSRVIAARYCFFAA